MIVVRHNVLGDGMGAGVVRAGDSKRLELLLGPRLAGRTVGLGSVPLLGGQRDLDPVIALWTSVSPDYRNFILLFLSSLCSSALHSLHRRRLIPSGWLKI